jgi:hypothetical protein
MHCKEDIVDLHKRADVGMWMTALILPMDFARRQKQDIIDRVETEPQNLLLAVSNGKYVEYNKVHTEANDVFPPEVKEDLLSTKTDKCNEYLWIERHCPTAEIRPS